MRRSQSSCVQSRPVNIRMHLNFEPALMPIDNLATASAAQTAVEVHLVASTYGRMLIDG